MIKKYWVMIFIIFYSTIEAFSQSNTGTLITAPIRPATKQNQIATAFANEIKGGHHQVANLIERNKIMLSRRDTGMLCTVLNDSTTEDQTVTYQLLGGLGDTNWVKFKASSNLIGGTGIVIHNDTIDIDIDSALFNASRIRGNLIDTTEVDSGQILFYNGNTWTYNSFDSMLNSSQLNDSFDGNRTITRSGIPQVNLGTNGTVADFIESFFFPDVGPQCNITGGTTLEHGDPNLSRTLNWSVTKNTNPITSIIIDSTTIVATGGSQSGNYNVNLTQGKDETITITVSDSSLSSSNSTGFSWKYSNYYGALSSLPASVISMLAGQKASSIGLTDHLASNKKENHSYNCSGGKYIYILYPAIYGDPVSVKNGVNTFSAFSIANIKITDRFSISRNYKLFYTGLQTGSSVNINIVN